ncbi:hypothetical protein NW759_005935 [Fusarium solani]|nr:hypothetical protein NW759_005935 [Fusarium solani]
MVLPYDPNNPYDPEDVSHMLLSPASATNVEVEPEPQRVSLDTNQPNWQQDATKSANIVEIPESGLPTDLDAPMNYSYQPSLSTPTSSMSQSLTSFPSTSRTQEHFECGSDSKRLRLRIQGNKTCNPPPRKGGASNNAEGCISVGGRRWPRRNNASRRKRTPQPLQTYACPLYQQNREEHKRCKNCILTSWARVMQHLTRTHLAKEYHCPRCRGSFRSETQKNEHIRLGNCQPADIAQSGVFLEDDYNKLKYIRHNSDEGKWTEAWGRLFPNLPAPSPFYESDAEIIRRTGRQVCISALLKAAQGHGDLPALADELLGDLTRTLGPAARGGDIDTAATQVPQATDPGYNRNACSPGILSQVKQVMRRTAHFRDLPEASPLMVPPQVPPDTHLPSQEQIFAQTQPNPPGLSGVGQFSLEAFQGWLPLQHSYSMASQLPQDLSLSQSSFVSPANLHNNLYHDCNPFVSGEEMISDEWPFRPS